MILLMYPKVHFAFPVILSMWEFQDRALEMSTQVPCTSDNLVDLNM